jgi:hypothetical protein
MRGTGLEMGKETIATGKKKRRGKKENKPMRILAMTHMRTKFTLFYHESTQIIPFVPVASASRE